MTKSISFPEPAEEIPEFTWSLERYHSAIELGLLTENDNVELLFGKLIEKMPTGSPHAACIAKIKLLLNRRFLGELEVRSENPVTLPNASEPESDLIIAIFKEDFYASGHPQPDDIHLLVEVSSSTLYIDRTVKSAIYAMAGIQEYWIVNLNNRQLELHIRPNTDDGTYRGINHYGEEETFTSPFLGEMNVKDLLP